MNAKRKALVGFISCFLMLLTAAWQLSAQQAASPDATGKPQDIHDQIAQLTPDDRIMFDALRAAVEQEHDAEVLSIGKKLLPALKTDTLLSDFVTQITAGAAVEIGETDYALTLTKPSVDAHPKDWHSAALLVRIYAESGEKALRDQQIGHLLDLHKKTDDPDFAKLHVFPIQKVKLHSGYAVFLYPFEPLGRDNAYLVALIYTNEGKQDYRIEIDSDDGDQAFFKAKKPGARRFSIDSYRQNPTNPNWPESQALYGFIDGVFDYDAMRDRIIVIANDEDSKHK
ncbi:MAG: hypothetical protein ABR976_00345 [Terracidiphilus sp.]